MEATLPLPRVSVLFQHRPRGQRDGGEQRCHVQLWNMLPTLSLPFSASIRFLYRLVFLFFISFSTFLLQGTQVSHLSQSGLGRGQERPLKHHFRCHTKRRGEVTTVFKCGGGFSGTGTPTRWEVMLVVSWTMNIYTYFSYIWLVSADCCIFLLDNLSGVS